MTAAVQPMKAEASQTRPGAMALWRWLALGFTALIIAHMGLHAWQFSGHNEMFGATGLRNGGAVYTPGEGIVVQSLPPQSPAARAGIRTGDRIVFDRSIDYARPALRSEAIGLTVTTDGVSRHVEVEAEAGPGRVLAPYLAADVIFLISALLGGVIILRSGNRASSLLLGTALVSYAVTGQWPRLWEAMPQTYALFYVVLSYIYYGSSALMLLATQALRREATGRDSPRLKALSYGVIGVHAILIAVLCWSDLDPASLPALPADKFLFYTVPVFTEYALAALTLVFAGREVPAADRSRYGLMLCAVLLIIASGVIDGLVLSTGNDYTTVRPLLVSWYVALFAGIALFAYAILRHRVIDLGFAVNQTLVYGVVSFVILLLFGLAEWGIEKVLPHEWHEHIETNAFISAGIALAIFLAFHHLRDAVEHVIEGVFFHRWRQNEAALDCFVKQAAHILKPDALKSAVVAEFARFSGGADVAIYRSAGLSYVRDGGAVEGLAETLDADRPALVALRADGKPLYAEDAEALRAGLVLPMIQRNDLTGFLVMGPKPSGDVYRPDERAALAGAAHKIGLDLHALRVEELEAEAAAHKARADIFEAQVQNALRGTSPA